MSWKKKIIAVTPMIALIVFLLLGFCGNLWHPGWVVFLAVPIVPTVLGKKGIHAIYPSIVIIVYFILGFVWNWWHPGWIIFLTIPVVETLISKPRNSYDN